MPVVTISLATAALSQYNMAELVPATIKESTTRDMFYSGSLLGTVPGSEGNMTHAHTRTLNSPVLLHVQSHFLEGGGKGSILFWCCQAHSTPLLWASSVVGCGQGSGPVPASPQCVPVLVLFLIPAETGWSCRWKRVCGAHTDRWGIHLAVNHCHMKWQGHHLGNCSAAWIAGCFMAETIWRNVVL